MSLMLMACYDRKVTREFMADMIDRAAMMNICLSGLEAEARLYLYRKGATPATKPARGKKTACQPPREIPVTSPEIEQLSKAFNAMRKTMADKFALVTQCPTSENTIS